MSQASETSPRAPRESLTEILQIEGRGDGRFGARFESFWGGCERGDLAARASLAALRGETRVPAAIQTHFFGDTPPDVDLELSCEALTTDRKRVRIEREGEAIGEVVLRFGPTGEGLTYQSVALEAGLPAPEDLPSEREVALAEGWAAYAVGPIEARRIGEQTPVKDDEPALWLGWLRPREPLSRSDEHLNAAALAFLSQYRSHWAVERRLGEDFPRSQITLQEHSLWIHRAESWDDFWLVKTSSEVGVAGRCFSRREIYSRAGALLASAAWEAEVRTPR